MKRFTLMVAALLAGAGSIAQINEDFEGYTVGDYMGVVSPDWSTWSGSTGGAEDVQVGNTLASSGSQSIYFSSTSSTGGPQDVVVDFGGEHNTGQFLFETDMYVESGKGGYFNFQGNTVIGTTWSLNIYCVQDGNFYVDDGVTLLLTDTYPTATWFTLTIDINLNTNDWEILIDGSSLGVVQTELNQVASLDLFPVNSSFGGNDISGYYIDDIEYTHTPYALPTTNGAVTGIQNIAGLATQQIQPSIKVRNLGTSTITSFDLEVTYDGSTINETITGVSIASLDFYDVPMAGTMTLAAGANDIVATISNVNGSDPDDDTADDSKTVTIDPVVPAVGKVVWGEEATGTWCQWCPRGAVFMDYMESTYGEFWEGAAVHNGGSDPMVDADYDTALGGIISGYPSGVVDRQADIDPSAFEADFLTRVQMAPTATITPGAWYDETGSGDIYVSLTTEFLMAATGTDFTLALVVTEDSVTGTTSGYAQSNAYAGGSAGVMGGYELLPNPVPASQMIYDHVARVIMPGFGGQGGLFPSSVTSGETFITNFTVTPDPSWDVSKMHFTGILIASSGVDNAGAASYDEAVSTQLAEVEDATPVTTMNMYPNPANDQTQIELGEVNGEMVTIKIIDVNGKVVAEKNYGELNGNLNLPINISQLSQGLYMVNVTVGDRNINERLVVE